MVETLVSVQEELGKGGWRMDFVMKVDNVNRNSVDGLEKMIFFHSITVV